MVLIYSVILLVVLLGFASFAVDYGRVQVVKLQLHRTADAAARAAASSLSSGITATQNAASTVAAANTADGSAVAIDTASDVEFGTWTASSKTFTVLSGNARTNANAVRVTCRRTAARGNAVPLLFARAVGKSACDVTASAIATAAAPEESTQDGIGFVGLSNFNSSNITTDSYDGSAGSYASQSHGKAGSLSSNSNIAIWNSTINGDVHPGTGKSVQGGSISGSTSSLTSTLSYTADPTPSSNNNANISPLMTYSTGTFSGGNLQTWGAITLPGGTYVLTNLNASAPITFTGPAKLYISNQCNVNGSGYLGTYQNKPANLLIVAGSQLNLYPAQPVYADIFSPTAQLNTSPGGTSHFYGQIIVHDWYVYNMNLHYDTSLPSHNPSGGPSSSSGGSSGNGSGSTVSIVN